MDFVREEDSIEQGSPIPTRMFILAFLRYRLDGIVLILIAISIAVLWTTYHGDTGLKSALTGVFVLCWTLLAMAPYTKRHLARVNSKAENSDDESDMPRGESRSSGASGSKYFSSYMILWLVLFPASIIVSSAVYRKPQSCVYVDVLTLFLGTLRSDLDSDPCQPRDTNCAHDLWLTRNSNRNMGVRSDTPNHTQRTKSASEEWFLLSTAVPSYWDIQTCSLAT